MTIGMLIESMAGKSAASCGRFHDGTPFAFQEHRKAVDFFGSQLCAAGYEYFGSEPVYSGLSGLLMRMEIFVGIVYYQRLRHMVSDKSQVRGTGPVHPLTQQPVKGRKRHGGIRLGEMERDSLLAHGISFLLHDRLVICSDSHPARVFVDTRCGAVLALHPPTSSGKGHILTLASITIPYVFRYLKNELAGMNICIGLFYEK